MQDEAGFDAFVRERGPRLLRAAWLLTGGWAAAEDLVQTALERTWPKWTTIGEPAAETYVRTVMTRAFLQDRRRRWSGEAPTDPLPDRPADENTVGIDQRSDLVAAVRALPPRQRAVLTWRYFADLSEADTAAVMGCGVGTVKSYTSRALAALRDHPRLRAEEEIG